jgi:hypothetical protein
MSDMSKTIIPKSDQLNADDLISGPITIKITKVVINNSQEQKVSIYYEGDNGKPYKSCKSMNRVLVYVWGKDSQKYTGKSMTLYREESVKWGGMEVGGIRISHMSDIAEPVTMALTATKGSKKLFTVKPLTVAKNAAPQPTPVPADTRIVGGEAAGAAPVINAAQHRRLEARITEVGISRDKVKKYCLKTWNVEHLNELTQEQYNEIDAMLDDYAAKHPKSDGGIIDMEDSQL